MSCSPGPVDQANHIMFASDKVFEKVSSKS